MSDTVYAVGETVTIIASGATGVITDKFKGPLSGEVVYTIADYGYYAEELRLVVPLEAA